jgi:ankyrin repeat protein
MNSAMNIFFRLDSSYKIGSGHLIRCLRIAESISKKNKIYFITNKFVGNFNSLVKKYNVLYLKNKENKQNQIQDYRQTKLLLQSKQLNIVYDVDKNCIATGIALKCFSELFSEFKKYIEIADINRPLHLFYTSLHIACFPGGIRELSKIKELVQAGANVNLNSIDGYSFLYKISYRGYHEIVNIALKNVTNINEAKNDQAATALHAAAMNDHLKVVYLLVAKGIDITIHNFEGKTALKIAREASSLKIAGRFF